MRFENEDSILSASIYGGRKREKKKEIQSNSNLFESVWNVECSHGS